MNSIVSVNRDLNTATYAECSMPHWHLICCTNGSGHVTLPDERCLDYFEGMVVVIPPNTSHGIAVSEGYTDIRIFLDKPTVYFQDAFVVSDNPQEYVRATFEQAWLCMNSNLNKAEQLLDTLGDIIVNYISALNTEANYSAPVKRIHDLILQNYTYSNFALDDAIRQMPFHYDYLRKRFKQEVGLTPREYLTELRMKKARTMLAGTFSREFTVNEVAQQCGFEDPLYFSRIFKKHNGVPPSCYAKNTHTEFCRYL